MSYTICPICGNKTLARLEPSVPNNVLGVDICYICDECGAELDINKQEPKPSEEDW